MSKIRTSATCNANETKTGQPTVSRWFPRTAGRWRRPTIARTGPCSVSPDDAPWGKIDALKGEMEPILIHYGGAFP
jgi:hypothetical protein